MLDASNLILTYSGGPFNTDPNASLGGIPSNTIITSGSINNLFNNVNEVLVNKDYRAIYLTNTHATDTYYNVSTWMTGGSAETTIKMGVPNSFGFSINIYDITAITGGSFTLVVNGTETSSILWNSSTPVAVQIQIAINAVASSYSYMVIDTITTLTEVSYILIHSSSYGNSSTLTVGSNDLTTNSSPIVIDIVANDPTAINEVAADIGISNNAPVGIAFSMPSEGSPIILGDLGPKQFVPIWFERTLPIGLTLAAETDSFSLKFTGEIDTI